MTDDVINSQAEMHQLIRFSLFLSTVVTYFRFRADKIHHLQSHRGAEQYIQVDGSRLF